MNTQRILTLPLKGAVLVCRTDAIGDLVLTTPVFQVLKSHRTDFEIDALVSSSAAPILYSDPCLREVLIDPGDLRKRILLLSSRKYAAALAVRPELGLALALRLSGIPVRVGTSRRAYSFLFSHRISLHRRFGGRHEAECNLALLEPFGIQESKRWAKIHPCQTDLDRAEEILIKVGLPTEAKFIAVHPGSNKSAPNLPYTTYARIISRLSGDYPVVLTGSPEETAPLHQSLESLVETESRTKNDKLEISNKAAVYDLSGKTDLRSLIGILVKAQVLVASSTGPLHLAAALGTRVVSFYGRPSEVSSRRWKPWVSPELYRILEPQIEACPSSCRGRCGRTGCLSHISAEDIIAEVRRLLLLDK